MEADLAQILQAVRLRPQELDETTQRRFAHAIPIDPANRSDRETVEVLTNCVENLDLRLALRLAIWYIDNSRFFIAAHLVKKAVRNRADNAAGFRVPQRMIPQIPLSRLREAEKELDSNEDVEDGVVGPPLRRRRRP
ncbi:hypothetical protein F5Y07DRAFT_411208 [Xylaria sp. FL0933]|nr:hypothetical protein F5Y07DRAFT_411208 [Xylaria sp. FL0933]